MSSGPRTRTVFLSGCGRSGTTVLGTLVSKHRQIRFLNDCFELWVEHFPVADIWGMGPHDHPARVALDAADAEAAGPEVRQAFLSALDRARDLPVLVEKLAINNFRLPFLQALCPDALFINILRHGVEVARSIEQRAAAGRWYGRDLRKWSLLVDHARSVGLGDLAARCAGGFERGLLEWRLSVEAAERGFRQIPADRLLQVRYDELLDRPGDLCTRLEEFLGLPHSPSMREFATTRIARRSPDARTTMIPSMTETIAGDCLRRHGFVI